MKRSIRISQQRKICYTLLFYGDEWKELMKQQLLLTLVTCLAYFIDKELYKTIDYLKEQVRGPDLLWRQLAQQGPLLAAARGSSLR